MRSDSVEIGRVAVGGHVVAVVPPTPTCRSERRGTVPDHPEQVGKAKALNGVEQCPLAGQGFVL